MSRLLLSAVFAAALCLTGCGGTHHAPATSAASVAATPLAAARTPSPVPAQPTPRPTAAPAAPSSTPRPAPTAVATPVASPAAARDRCHTAQLAVSFAGAEGAAGHIFDTFALLNHSDVACTLYGFVGAQMLDAQGGELPTRVVRNGGMLSNQPGPTKFVLQPGGVASFQAEWSDVPSGNETVCPAAAQLEVTPPDETTFLVLDLGRFALAPCGGGTINVSPVVAVAPCRTAALQLGTDGPISEPTGQHSLSLVLANRGTDACLLFGYPAVMLLDAVGNALPFDYKQGGDQVVTPNPPAPVIVPPGGSAFVTINKYRCDLGDRDLAATIRLAPPGSPAPLQLSLAGSNPGLAYCGPGDPGSVVAVSPVGATKQDTVAHP